MQPGDCWSCFVCSCQTWYKTWGGKPGNSLKVSMTYMEPSLCLFSFLADMHCLHIIFCGYTHHSSRKHALQCPKGAPLWSVQPFSSWLMRGESDKDSPTDSPEMMASHKLSGCANGEKRVCLTAWATLYPDNCQTPSCWFSSRINLSLAPYLHLHLTPPVGEYACGGLNALLPFVGLLLFCVGSPHALPMLQASPVFLVWTFMTFLLQVGVSLLPKKAHHEKCKEVNKPSAW